MQFTIIFFREQERRAQKPRKGEKALGPEIPERAEERGEEREAQSRADEHGEEHIEAQLTAADAEREGEQRGGEDKAVERVERSGQGAVRAAAQTQCAQGIVEQSKGRAEQERGAQARELRGDLNAHGQPPNRRLSSPPEEGAGS